MLFSCGDQSSFLETIPLLKTKFYVKDKQVYASLVDSEMKEYRSFTSDLGSIAIDFLYCTHFEQIVNFLRVSEEIVRSIKENNDVQHQWSYFERFIVFLFHDGNIHPFYYPLFVNIANAFRFNMHDAAGVPLSDDFFAQQGISLVDLKQRVSALLSAHDAIEEQGDILSCYYQSAFQQPLPITNLQAEFVSTPNQNPEMVMVISPNTADEIWNYLLTSLVAAGMRFKRCENCKRFFATTGRGNPKFCERIIPGKGKSCRQVMPKLNFNSKADKDPAVWLYNRAYKTMYSRVSTGNTPKEMFHEWAKRARTQRDACTNGEITAEEYSAWLCTNGLMIDYFKDAR